MIICPMSSSGSWHFISLSTSIRSNIWIIISGFSKLASIRSKIRNQLDRRYNTLRVPVCRYAMSGWLHLTKSIGIIRNDILHLAGNHLLISSLPYSIFFSFFPLPRLKMLSVSLLGFRVIFSSSTFYLLFLL